MSMYQREYDFLTGKTRADVDVFNYCRNFGWCVGLDTESRPALTKRGAAWIKNYKNNATEL